MNRFSADADTNADEVDDIAEDGILAEDFPIKNPVKNMRTARTSAPTEINSQSRLLFNGLFTVGAVWGLIPTEFAGSAFRRSFEYFAKSS
jgi:hypothetical protein